MHSACAARIFELIEEEPQTPDKDDARVLDEADGTLSLENVAFSYVSDRKLIENLNLNVKSGQRVAIVGPTAAENYINKSAYAILRCRQRKHKGQRNRHTRHNKKKPAFKLRYGFAGHLAQNRNNT